MGQVEGGLGPPVEEIREKRGGPRGWAGWEGGGPGLDWVLFFISKFFCFPSLF
jgi:hypothetical protein